MSDEVKKIAIDPRAIAAEAKALNDFLTSRNIQNAHEALTYYLKVDEIQKEHEKQILILTKEKDELAQKLEAANEEIAALKSRKARKDQSNG